MGQHGNPYLSEFKSHYNKKEEGVNNLKEENIRDL